MTIRSSQQFEEKAMKGLLIAGGKF